ncbi:MAG: Holliday junction branch migration protein RuvA [Firmicutes bacterium]|nr:Holliday junction branch migration protein RuvA [Clostridiales bacterium]MBQ9931614.1 Holliday junction branch migration protein RuvA [Bacillota bacterium]
MIHYIKGEVTMTFDGGVVIETGGLGYEVFVPSSSPLYNKMGQGPVLVYTAMMVREDDVSLYGFDNKESLLLFRRLLTVSGVGAKAAMSILSALPAGEVKKAIVFEDAAMLARANGIGKKTAQRIVLELKDKLDDVGGFAAEAVEKVAANDSKSEAIDALISLGFSRSEAVSSLAGVADETLTVEEYIKAALRNR